MHGVEVATLDTLQHRLAGYPEGERGFEHWQIAVGSVFDEAGTQFVGEPDAPWRAGGGLLGGDEPVGDPPVHGRGDDAEFAGGLSYGDRCVVAGRAVRPVTPSRR
jgi:hypothetical protein